MTPQHLFLVLGLAAPLALGATKKAPAPRSGWQQLGGLLSAVPGRTSAYNPSLAVARDGTLYVAWDEDDQTARNVYVRRFDGSAWRAVGGPLSAVAAQHTDASFPSLAVDASGRPWVAWREYDGAAGNIYVARWTGSAWAPVGGALSAVPGKRTDGFSPSLALDSQGNPVVAWSEYDGSSINVYVKRWREGTWEPLGGGLSASPGATHARRPSLALGPHELPVVAWTESGAESEDVHVERWAGQGWEALGRGLSAIRGAGTDASRVSLALEPDGTPVVAWTEFDTTARNIYVRRWAGQAWEPMGGPLSAVPGRTDALSPALALLSGFPPFLAWTEFDGQESVRVFTADWVGGAWRVSNQGLSALTGKSTDALTVDAVLAPGGAPVVVWSEVDATGTAQVTVWRRFLSSHTPGK